MLEEGKHTHPSITSPRPSSTSVRRPLSSVTLLGSGASLGFTTDAHYVFRLPYILLPPPRFHSVETLHNSVRHSWYLRHNPYFTLICPTVVPRVVDYVILLHKFLRLTLILWLHVPLYIFIV
uniref:Uncharacterized protein n=1 Tax=Triparma pacifica TaxID=91992 RepID=A0A7S2QW62_9STRA